MTEDASVALFCARAGVDPSDSIRTLCRLLDNLPLGIELAAARASLLDPTQLLARIEQRLDLLKGGRDADPRQTTLRAAIAWSYDLLNSDERDLFARMSVFDGGCTIEAAEVVACATLDTLESLVDKSLVQQGTGRISMYETIRQFATERRIEMGEEQQLGRRLFDYFLSLVESVPVGTWPRGWGEQLQLDHYNLRNALAGAPSPERCLQLACGLGTYWLRQGHRREGGSHLQAALVRAPQASPTLQANATLLLGQLSVGTEQHGRAAGLLNSALNLFLDSGDAGGQARAYLALGWLAFLQRDIAMATELHERGLERARDADAPSVVAHALGRMAAVADRRGDFVQVAAFEQESLKLMREIGDEDGIATGLSAMAWRAVRRRDYKAARSLTEQSAAVLKSVGRELSASMQHTLLIALLGMGLNEEVARQVPGALRRALAAGDMLSLAAMLEIAGGLAAQSGSDAKAAMLMGAAAGLVNRSGVANDELAEAREVYSTWLASARGRLGEGEWERDVAAGKEMSSEDSVALALSGIC